MKILITGATGLVGKELGKKLVKEGHELTVVTRNKDEAKSKLPFPAHLQEWSELSLQNIDCVINLVGESIAEKRWSKEQKKKIYDSRIETTRTLVDAVKKNPSVKQFISASAIGYYEEGFLHDVCRDWEKEVLALSSTNVKFSIARIGIVLSRYGGALEKMLPLFSVGFGSVIGNGKQWMNWIHIDDLVDMFVYLVDHPEHQGIFDAVAPTPVTNIEFSVALASAIRKPLFLPVPAFMLKLVMGELSILVTDGKKVSAHKIVEKGFSFRYPRIDPALEEICSPLRNGTKEHLSEIWLPVKIHDIYPFFSDEKNLERLTPSHLNFHVLGKSTKDMQAGTLIDYKLKLYGVPLRWKTRIEKWEPGKSFVDTQLNGPYTRWYHIHEFTELADGTLMRDKVEFKLPLGRIGELVAGWFVTNDVKKIFTFRSKAIAKIYHNGPV